MARAEYASNGPFGGGAMIDKSAGDAVAHHQKGGMKGQSATIEVLPTYPHGETMGLPSYRGKAGRRRRSRGQSLAEFALVFPVLMLIIGGVIQFGIIFWGQNSLNQVVRDAGRYAVTQPDCSVASRTDIANKVAALTSAMGVARLVGSPTITMPTNGEVVGGTTDPVSSTSVVGVNCPAKTNADHVWLRIKVDAQVPIFFPFVPGSGSISSTALFRMEPVTP